MTDTGREFALVGDHAENLHSGRMIAPSEDVHEAELDLGRDGTDQWLLDEGRLVEITPPDEPTLTKLRARAKELKIEGYTKLSPRRLRRAIDEAEAPIVAAAKQGVAEGDAREGGEV